MYTSILQKIPALICAVILMIAVVRIYFRSKNVTRAELLGIFKKAKLFGVWTLVAVFVLTAVFGIFNHMHSKHFAMAVVSLNYSEASQAQNSNGTRYNMAEILCDEVIKRAIDLGAFEKGNKKVAVKDLKSCLYVYPYVQGGVQSESEYHISTEFIVEYHASKKTQHLDAENVIKLVTSAYKEYYIEKYTDNYRIDTDEERPDFDKMEYLDIVSYFDKETNSILNYLYGMAEKSPSFVTENNTTFNSIAGKVFQFKETQIEQNLRSLILQHGITKNTDEYIERLSHQNTDIDFDRQKNAVSFDLCNQAIAMYAEEMTRVVLVPTWDEVGKYYMGRTKVGIDELSVKATEFSDEVASDEKLIMDNQLIIDKVQNSSKDLDIRKSADELIEVIDENIKEFAKEAITAGREYSSQKMNQCIAVSISGASLFSEIEMIILFAAFAYVSLILYGVSKKIPRRE